MRISLPKLKREIKIPKLFFLILLLGTLVLIWLSLNLKSSLDKSAQLERDLQSLKISSQEKLDKISKELAELKNQDSLKKNEELQNQIDNIQATYRKAVAVYEDLLDLRTKSKNTADLEKDFADALFKLAKKDLSGANDVLTQIANKISQEEEKLAASFNIPQNVPQKNTPPSSGYSRQQVSVESLGSYMVSIVAADIGSTRVIVDTAADSDCSNNCPVLPLATYVSRNGAYAGINGTYFCPSEYPSCAGKTNSFDLLVMNHKKTYFNSGNNVFSNNPGVIFGDGYIRFVTAISQWGRDTSTNGVLSNFPLLVFNSNVVFGGDNDPKKGSKGGRSFVANKGNLVFIGVVHNATVAEAARVLAAMGMENALNLDDGGSTALWSDGYKVGPGRNLPNVILFVRK